VIAIYAKLGYGDDGRREIARLSGREKDSGIPERLG
jgi:hypothetical protein